MRVIHTIIFYFGKVGKFLVEMLRRQNPNYFYNPKVFRKGKKVSELLWPHMNVDKVRQKIIEAEKESGQPIGWRYIDGNTLVTRTTGDVNKVLPLIDIIEDEAFWG